MMKIPTSKLFTLLLILVIVASVGFLSQPITSAQPSMNNTISIKLSLSVDEPSSHTAFIQQAPANDNLWNLTLGGTRHDSGRAVVECTDGGYAIGGASASYGPGDLDMWLVRLDTDGNLLWNKTYRGLGIRPEDNDWCDGIVECSDGGFALIGSIGPVIGSIAIGWEMLLLRVNATGHYMWHQVFSGVGQDEGHSIVECSQGGFAIGGLTSSYGAGWDDMWLVRTDENGTFLWQNTFGGTHDDTCSSLIELDNGDFALLGETRSFGASLSEVWLVRANASGYHLWNRTYGGPSWDRGFSIVELANGNLVLTGSTESYGSGLADLWLIRTDATGIPLWQPTFGGPAMDLGKSVILCADGGLAMTGYTDSYGAGLSDLWVVRTNNNGDLLWYFPVGSDVYEEGFSLIESSDGSFIAVGYTGSYGFEGRDLLVAQIPAVPPTTPTTPTTPTGPIDLGFLLAIILPILTVTLIASIGFLLWRRLRRRPK